MQRAGRRGAVQLLPFMHHTRVLTSRDWAVQLLPFTSRDWAIRGPRRAQATHLLRRRQLTLAGRLALRRVVHHLQCEMWWIGLVRAGCQAISECSWAMWAGLVLRARAHKGQRAAARECAPTRQG